MTRRVFHTVWRGLRRGRKRFKLWRRGRPFWGGLLLILAGLELWSSPTLNPLSFEISFGPQGFLAVLLPVLLVLCGLLAWITPQYRYFYGIVGLITAVYSFLGLNLGGWLIGMLLGIIGGSLVVAWTPITPPSPAPASPEPAGEETGPADPDAPTLADELLEPEQPTVPQQTGPLPDQTGPLTDQTPGPDQIPPVQAPRQPPRTFVVVALPVLLIGATAVPLLAAAQEAGCEPQADTLAATATAAPEPTVNDTGGDDRTLLVRIVDVLFGWLDDGSDDSAATAQAAPEPSPGPTPPPDEPCPEPTAPPTAGPSPEPEPSDVPSPEPSDAPSPEPTDAPTDGPPASDGPSPSPEPSLTPPPEVPVPPGHPLVSSDPSLLTAGRLNLDGFVFEGIAELPTAEGSIVTLKFRFDRAVNINFTMVSNRRSDPVTIAADRLTLSGDVEFYASRFQGRALGLIPITLDAQDPGLLEQLLELVDLPLPLFFTDVEQELVFTHGATLTASGFRQA
ncbi:MAG TPA: DUF6114 domain-containing protein [Natronosporangium sp.]|nr:DUF6114 domain-containing protein [Natronosporangium sp.]